MPLAEHLGREFVTFHTLHPLMTKSASRKSYLMTDEAGQYIAVGREFSGHGTVNHSAGEYVRGIFWHSNSAESFFALLKRGVRSSRRKRSSRRPASP